ncbi:PREDICTED: probable G-protein coupled receptor 157 [Amphimedon queenslandica]|uniref:G-protein coupled receptors family 2 profile 2 domain-containing protein n=1 Tax=Amphimedon queenslandica TaxID=400682 RepID=A0A1X7VFT0_AMPQE|nr:PREDICTED: probable G-protein coupled receptor 157 [Amphimedon queenslandica]|eukprot:XP_019848975.1 PREDICTED: probable G-protein coupled receptor 157 [Amphimedon queenslandica]
MEEDECLESLYIKSSDCVDVSCIDREVKDTLPFTLVSSILSVLGSTAIIIPFFIWREMRASNTRRIIFLLAVADLFTAASFISAVVRHYIFLEGHEYDGEITTSFSIEVRKDTGYKNFCEVQAFFTVYFQCVAFFLTAFLAVYFFIILVLKNLRLARKLMLPFCLSAWAVPIIICGYVLSHRKFGIGDSRTSVGWCFIDNKFVLTRNRTKHDQNVVIYFLWELFAQKLWEMLAFFVIIVCYCFILFTNRCKCRKKIKLKSEESSLIESDEDGQWTTRHAQIKPKPSTPAKGMRDVQAAISKADWRLALVPLVFLLLRFWGNLRFFISMMNNCHVYAAHPKEYSGFFCVEPECFNLLYNKEILTLHAIGDPAQGFGNAILFVFLSRNIMSKLLGPVLKVFRSCRKKNDVNNNTRNDSRPSRAAVIVTYHSKDKKSHYAKIY